MVTSGALSFVRHELEVLAAARLLGPFDPEAEEAYERLCAQERSLLAAAYSVDTATWEVVQ